MTGRLLAQALRRPASRTLVRAAGLAGLLPRDACWGWPVPPAFRVPVGLRTFRYLASPGDQVAAPLYWAGLRTWEAETFAVFVPLARRARGLLDVGAYTGVFTLAAATVNPGLRALAFEPNPARCAALARNLAANDLAGRCRAVRSALGDESGRGHLFVPAADDSSARLAPGGTHGDGALVEVDVRSPAEAVPDGFPLDLVKIDVEGAEGSVLAGLEPLLVRHRPALVCEFLGAGPHAEAEGVLDRLGYRRWHLDRRGPVPVARVGGHPSPLHNYLCLPADARGVPRLRMRGLPVR